MSRLVLSAAVVVLLSSGGASAQDTPDFTGTWQMDMTRSESAAQGADASPRMPVTIVITQTRSHFTVETRRDGDRQNVKYVFGEAERVEPVGTSRSDEFRVEPANVKWNGVDLITTTLYRISGMSVKQTQTRRLAAGGHEMEVETRLEMQHGYESSHPQYQSQSVVKDVFTRVTQ